MHEVRCNKCNKLLAKVSSGSRVEVKCPRCKTINQECLEHRRVGDDYVKTSGAVAGRQTQAG